MSRFPAVGSVFSTELSTLPYAKTSGERPVSGIVFCGHLLTHVESFALDAGGSQDGGVEGVDRALAVELCEPAGLEGAVAVAQRASPARLRRWCAGRVGVVAGVDDQGVVHHRSAALRHTLQLFHQLHQHAAVVLADLDPDRVVRLLHVPQVVPLLLHAQALPRAEDLAAARTDGEHAGDARFEGGNAEVQKAVVPVGFEFGIAVTVVHLGREFPQVVGNTAEALAQAVDVIEP